MAASTSSISCALPLNASNSQKSYASTLVRLKFVSTINEGERLREIIQSGEIDSSDQQFIGQISRYSWDHLFQEILDKESGVSIDDAEFVIITLMRLLSLHNHTEETAHVLAFKFETCLASTAQFDRRYYLNKKGHVCLSFWVHKDLLRTCEKILKDPRAHAHAKKVILISLPYIINHREMSADEVMLSMRLHKKHIGLIIPFLAMRSLHDFVALENAIPAAQEDAFDTLSSIAQNLEFSQEERKEAIKLLPFFFTYSNVLPGVRKKSVEILCDLIPDEKVDFPLREQAIQQLSNWLWVLPPDKFKEYRFALETLITLLKPQKPELIKMVIDGDLFHFLWVTDQSHPVVQTLLPIFTGMLTSDEISLDLKMALAKDTPFAGHSVFVTKEAIPLFRFMVEQIKTKEIPRKLKDDYIDRITSILIMHEKFLKDFPELKKNKDILFALCHHRLDQKKPSPFSSRDLLSRNWLDEKVHISAKFLKSRSSQLLNQFNQINPFTATDKELQQQLQIFSKITDYFSTVFKLFDSSPESEIQKVKFLDHYVRLFPFFGNLKLFEELKNELRLMGDPVSAPAFRSYLNQCQDKECQTEANPRVGFSLFLLKSWFSMKEGRGDSE